MRRSLLLSLLTILALVLAACPVVLPVAQPSAEELPAVEEEAPAPEQETDAVAETAEVTETAEITVTEQITEPALDRPISEEAVQPETGVAELQDREGNVVGTAAFSEVGEEPVIIQVELTGLDVEEAGAHGIHIHETGACEPDFEAAGAHFNPTGAEHGLENPQGPHAGDLPNIEIDENGNAIYEATTDRIDLGDVGELAIFDEDGSALIIHAQPDDQMTDPDGGSGDRIVCGVIRPTSQM